MIVKNEAPRILRALNSAVGHVSCYAIQDTGSTDETVNIIKEWGELHNIPGDIGHGKFIHFAQARNDGLALARKRDDWDWLLLFDADMELVVKDPTWLDSLSNDSFDMYQCAGALHYQNRRLLWRGANPASAIYLTPTHEFLNAGTGGCISMDKALFVDHADGSNRPEKFKRDIKIFKKALKNGEEPKDRIYYYLAQSYRDAGEFNKAAEWYQRRIDVGGWPEEIWSAHTNIAACHGAMGNVGEFIRWNLAAYNFRPSRAESLFDLAKYFREKGEVALALIFADAGKNIPLSTDALFVNDYVYRRGLRDEFSICAYYNLARRMEGFKVCDELALERTPYGFSIQLADSNLLHYMLPLGVSLGGIELKQIEFTAEEHWIAMNPSICLHRGEMKALVRTVNYRMDEDGRYLIRATDGTANNVNPINTRNWLVPLDRDLSSITQVELTPREPVACDYPLVVGFEDARIFDNDNNLYISATVRQRAVDGLAEQTLARIGGPAGGPNTFGGFSKLGLDDVTPMLRTPRLYEKNWMPITGEQIRFMYRPGHVVGADGQDLLNHGPTHLRSESFSGGSQLIPFNSGWLGVIHEAHHYIDRPWKRYYSHRFVWYTFDFRLGRVSRPFFFKDKVIEFVAGMCYHPEGWRPFQDEQRDFVNRKNADLIISFGFKDCEAWLARCPAKAVWDFVCQGQSEPKSV
jgi:glycosyltransferase involved in cell wall biosynthesis